MAKYRCLHPVKTPDGVVHPTGSIVELNEKQARNCLTADAVVPVPDNQPANQKPQNQDQPKSEKPDPKPEKDPAKSEPKPKKTPEPTENPEVGEDPAKLEDNS